MSNISPNTFWPNTSWPSGGASSSGGGLVPPSQNIKYRFWSTAANSSPDYSRYLYEQPVKMDRINEPDYLDASLVPWDSAFVKLSRGAYMQFDTGSFGTWFTGFVTNDPELEQLGTKAGSSVFGYKYEVASEDYLLNLKPLGILPPFLNTTQGQILKQLVAILAPEYNFDVTGIQDGLAIARYIADPQKKFTDIVKEFAEAAYYRWSCRNGKLYYAQQDTTPANIVIDGSNQNFTPSKLSLKPSQDPIINDALVLGDIEPQNYMIEYFVGNGFEKKFSLVSSVYGVDSSVLLDDDFSNSEIDSTKWDVFDDPQSFIQLFNGYVNCLGGRNDGSFGVYLQSANLIPLEGNLKITHGEWDFVQASDGVIASLWTDTPTSNVPQNNFSNCVYGIRVTKNGTSTTMQPITNGQVDSTQSFTISNYNYRYVIRTVFTFQQQFRFVQNYASMSANGTVTQHGGTILSDYMSASTWITVIDPNTTNIVQSVQWDNIGVLLPDTSHFAYYDPAVLNDLHATFTGITVSTPLQAALYSKALGASAWTGQIIGPNEMDAFDGLAPVATIVDANQGWTTKSSKLGRKQYNPGNAALEYFSDPTKTADQQYVPPEASWIRLAYRRAGAAMARVQNRTSVTNESTAWGDSGIRSVTRQDLQPAPRTSAECEFAAQAIVNDFSRQHWDGTYTQYSLYEFTGEPISGTVLKFQNMPSDYPSSLTAETIQEIKTTFLSASPNECFQHEIKFGRKDALKKEMASFTKKVDVFQPQDTAEIPDSLTIDSIGIAFAPDVPNAEFTTWDRNNLSYTTNQAPPSGGGFEVRYTDESWGCDDSKNLALRTSGPTFSIPRTLRSRVIFIRAYDVRNNILYSEDMTTSVWDATSSTTVTNVMDSNPDDAKSMISVVTFDTSQNGIDQTIPVNASGASGCYSISIKASTPTDVGKQATLEVKEATGNTIIASLPFTLTKNWTRYSVSFTAPVNAAYGNLMFTVTRWGQTDFPATAKITRASTELNTQTETVYCKTKGVPYGSLSRYSTGVHVAMPMIPPAPTATIDPSKITTPVVTITLPAAQTDVWGIAVRATDNTTTLYQQSLESPGVTLSPAISGNKTRQLQYYVYTYNILGEYSDPFSATGSIPSPSISNLYVDDAGKTLHWNGIGANSFLVEVDATDSSMSHVYWQGMESANSLGLRDVEFFPQRWFGVTPFDDIGAGTPSVIGHQYTPAAIVTWDNTVATSVPPPPTPSVNPAPPPSALAWKEHYIGDAWRNYAINRYRYE